MVGAVASGRLLWAEDIVGMMQNVVSDILNASPLTRRTDRRKEWERDNPDERREKVEVGMLLERFNTDSLQNDSLDTDA